MDWQHIDWQHALPYLTPILVVAIVLRRAIRNAPRNVSPSRMFIIPLIFGVGTVATIAYSPVPGLFWIVGYAVALALGAGVGFLTTHHQEFAVDPETGKLTARATPIGTILVLGLFAARYAVKFIAPHADPQTHHPSADVLAWTDAGLIFATAMIAARAVTTWVHTKPLLDAHKAANLPPAL
jgi:hypothetical protein